MADNQTEAATVTDQDVQDARAQMIADMMAGNAGDAVEHDHAGDQAAQDVHDDDTPEAAWRAMVADMVDGNTNGEAA